MRVEFTKEYKKHLKSKKVQKNHLQRIDKILNLIYTMENYKDLQNNTLAKGLYKFEQLKYDLKAYFSFRIDNKEMRLIVKPNTITDYDQLHLENEILIVDISFEHYKDLKRKM